MNFLFLISRQHDVGPAFDDTITDHILCFDQPATRRREGLHCNNLPTSHISRSTCLVTCGDGLLRNRSIPLPKLDRVAAVFTPGSAWWLVLGLFLRNVPNTIVAIT